MPKSRCGQRYRAKRVQIAVHELHQAHYHSNKSSNLSGNLGGGTISRCGIVPPPSLPNILSKGQITSACANHSIFTKIYQLVNKDQIG